VNAAGGSFSQGSGTLARQNTMQATGAGSGLTGKTVIDSPLQRSPDKKGGLTLDLSRVVQAPPSVRAPPPIKYAPGSMDSVPIAPSTIPRPSSASTDASKPSDGSRPTSGGAGSSKERTSEDVKRAMGLAPLAPRGVPLPAPRGGPGGMQLGSGPPLGALGGGGGGGGGGRAPPLGSPGHVRRPMAGGAGSPEATTLKIIEREEGDEGEGYSMAMEQGYSGFTPTPLATVAAAGGGGGLGFQRSGRGPPPPRGGPPPASASAAAAAANMANRMPPRGAPPTYSAAPMISPPRFMPPGMNSTVAGNAAGYSSDVTVTGAGAGALPDKSPLLRRGPAAGGPPGMGGPMAMAAGGGPPGRGGGVLPRGPPPSLDGLKRD